MATVNGILDLARLQTHTKTSDLPNTDAIQYLNIAYQRVGAKLVAKLDEKYFYERWTRDAVADQENGEYPYPEAGSQQPGMRKLISLWVKTNKDDTHRTKAREVDPSALDFEWAWYLQNQSLGDPIFFIGDESFFIAPGFVAESTGAAGNGQILCEGVKKLVDLEVGGAETTILVPADYHWILAKGMEPNILRQRGKRAEANTAEAEFNLAIQAMIEDLTDRVLGTTFAALPDDTHLADG